MPRSSWLQSCVHFSPPLSAAVIHKIHLLWRHRGSRTLWIALTTGMCYVTSHRINVDTTETSAVTPICRASSHHDRVTLTSVVLGTWVHFLKVTLASMLPRGDSLVSIIWMDTSSIIPSCSSLSTAVLATVRTVQASVKIWWLTDWLTRYAQRAQTSADPEDPDFGLWTPGSEAWSGSSPKLYHLVLEPCPTPPKNFVKIRSQVCE